MIPWAECAECALGLYRKKAVGPRGLCKRRLVFVGEAPGEQEEKIGLAFVGPSGRMLDYWLGVLELSEDDVYVTNIVKCRPPKNRDPRPTEVEACMPWLHGEVERLSPVLVVALGRFAKSALDELKKVHGELSTLSLKHPAYYLRQGVMPGDELRYLKRRLAQLEGEKS